MTRWKVTLKLSDAWPYHQMGDILHLAQKIQQFEYGTVKAVSWCTVHWEDIVIVSILSHSHLTEDLLHLVHRIEQFEYGMLKAAN